MQNQNTNGKEKSSMGSFRRGQLRFIWGWIIIPICSWLVWFLYVNLSSFVQAFQDRTGQWSFINFVQFWKSITNKDPADNHLYVAIGNTFKFFGLSIFVNLPIQFLVAYFLFKKIAGYKFFRIVFYFPVIISNIAMTAVFKEVISPLGPLGEICSQIGIKIPDSGLLGNTQTVIPTVMVYSVWDSIGLQMLLFCGSMSRIPIEVLESGRLDGVGAGRELVQLILPMIWPTLSTIIVLRFTEILGSSGQILLLVGDNHAFSLNAVTISHWIFNKVYAGGNHMQGQYSLVSATGLCLTLVSLPIILFVKWLIVEKVPTVEY